MNPFFSIVIVNYNHGRFLEEAILSILSQSCKDFEIIFIDGGSTDNSLEVIHKYKSSFSWWVSEKDKGQSEAFNKGFSKAKGTYYLWLNADDLLMPNTLQKVKDYLLINDKCKWLAGNTITMNVNNLFLWCIRGPIFWNWLIKHGTAYIYGPSSFFHKELFVESGGFDESLFYTMDTDLWYRFLNYGHKFNRINHYCWAFRVHEDSKTSHSQRSQPSEKFANEKLKIEIKNKRSVYKITDIFLLVFKVVTGTLFVRYYHNLKMKNKKIVSV